MMRVSEESRRPQWATLPPGVPSLTPHTHATYGLIVKSSAMGPQGADQDQDPFWNHTLSCSVHTEDRLMVGRACFLVLFCVGDDDTVVCILQLHNGHLRALGLGVEMMEVDELCHLLRR